MNSPPPDYIRAMGNLGFDGAGGGPLDSIAGIPKRGDNDGSSMQDTEDYFCEYQAVLAHCLRCLTTISPNEFSLSPAA
jgi:hypothetical protein